MRGASEAVNSTHELHEGVTENLFVLLLLIIIVEVRKEIIF